jgi:ABC-2 type transport system ATP-binding protein
MAGSRFVEGNEDEVALELRGLRKAFHDVAVDRLDLAVRSGEFYALLGPNGAGKTTTLKMIAGLMMPDSGAISVFGIDALREPEAAKRMIAWLPDEPMIYDKLEPLEYLEFIAGLWGVPPAQAETAAGDLLRRLGLWEARRQRCEGFSRGMRQKVALAGALVHDPKLLLLDEPLTGLDTAVARQVKDILIERVRAGAAVMLTTHILEVAEKLADRIGILHKGRLVAEGTLSELRSLGFGDQASLEEIFLDITRSCAA